MKPRHVFRLAFVVLFTAASGCGDRELRNNDQVEGTVTLDGVELPGVSLEFTPLALTPGKALIRSHAVTDENGHFTLTRVDKRSGAAISQHRVTVAPARSGPGARVPFVYRVSGSTPLYIDVSADQHSYELKLTKDAKSSGAREVGD